jgi:Ran GTPase-activating protein (RanGAP) involved in mRNA processing and transport
LQKCSRNGNLRATCLTHHCLTVSACIFACQSSDTWDIRDILDVNDSGSLSELDLSKNNLRSEGLSVVSEALKSTSIRQLNIAENMVTYNQQTKTDMSGVIKFTGDMKDMGSLSSLDISNNFLTRGKLNDSLKNAQYYEDDHPGKYLDDSTGVKALADAIQDMESLSKLNLSGNNIGGVGEEKETKAVMASLGAALKTSNVEVIDISSNNFEGDELEGFCQHIPDMGSLIFLNLAENDLRVEGAKHVADVLPKW